MPLAQRATTTCLPPMRSRVKENHERGRFLILNLPIVHSLRLRVVENRAKQMLPGTTSSAVVQCPSDGPIRRKRWPCPSCLSQRDFLSLDSGLPVSILTGQYATTPSPKRPTQLVEGFYSSRSRRTLCRKRFCCNLHARDLRARRDYQTSSLLSFRKQGGTLRGAGPGLLQRIPAGTPPRCQAGANNSRETSRCPPGNVLLFQA